MTSFRVLLSIAALTGASLALSISASADYQPESRYLLKTDTAQAAPGKRGMGMRIGATSPGYVDQMNAMTEMHEKMLTAITPDERNALMAEQMELMRNSMHMMGGMGGMGGMGAGAGTGSTDDMPARQAMMEERMGMMQSMMQMMMDRMQSVPRTK